jgi:nicotinamidase/pyrazinamidase
MDKDKEAYSAFDGLDLDDGENLDDILNHAGIVRVFVCGLAGEVCVLASAVAGHDLGYEVTLLPEATAWLGDPQPSSSRMRELGVDIIPSLRVV